MLRQAFLLLSVACGGAASFALSSSMSRAAPRAAVIRMFDVNTATIEDVRALEGAALKEAIAALKPAVFQAPPFEDAKNTKRRLLAIALAKDEDWTLVEQCVKLCLTCGPTATCSTPQMPEFDSLVSQALPFGAGSVQD